MIVEMQDVLDAISAVSATYGTPSMDWMKALYEELVRRSQNKET